MTPESLLNQITTGTAPVILDVRSKTEFALGHVPGAIHIPFWRMAVESDRLSRFKERPIVVYCGHGPRAYIAGSALRRAGFSHVEYLKGHMSKWKSLRLPLEVDK
jgi:rhodanese-related sulfurtransferase